MTCLARAGAADEELVAAELDAIRRLSGDGTPTTAQAATLAGFDDRYVEVLGLVGEGGVSTGQR